MQNLAGEDVASAVVADMDADVKNAVEGIAGSDLTPAEKVEVVKKTEAEIKAEVDTAVKVLVATDSTADTNTKITEVEKILKPKINAKVEEKVKDAKVVTPKTPVAAVGAGKTDGATYLQAASAVISALVIMNM